MSNSQALGSGDGSSNGIDTNGNDGSSSSSDWTNLPLSVYSLLGSKLDTNGHRAMRLVCTEWRKNVEQGVGLKVKVDASIEGNLEFVRRVKVGKARILNWTVDIGTDPDNHIFQHPDWVKKLKLCGKMPVNWKIHNLTQFPNLAHLVLRDRALHLNNLTGHQFPSMNFDPTSDLSLQELLTNAFQSEDPPSEAQAIELKSLRTLEIIKHTYNGYQRQSRLETHGYLVMVANVCFILNNVTSPLLTVAHLTVSIPDPLRDSLNKFNWTLGPLHRFLNNHHTSLRQLLLPSFRGKSSKLFQQEDLSNSFPINLRKLMLDLEAWSGFDDQEAAMQSNFVYLQNCLQRQTQLQDVHFDFYVFPLKWISDAFTSLANTCDRTLRYLELQGYPIVGGEETFDLQMLSVCHNLEVLHMPACAHASMTIKNVDKLPTSLKRLLICCGGNGSHIDIGDPIIFKRLTALEWLVLSVIRLPVAYNSGNQEPQQRQFCRTMIKGLLNLRKLEGFHLEMQEVALNTDPRIVEMLRPLDPSINPAVRYPQSKTNCNLNWRYYHYDRTTDPWSDRPFDIKSWDLEKPREDVDEPRQQAWLGFGPVGPPVRLNRPREMVLDEDDVIAVDQDNDIADDQDDDIADDQDDDIADGQDDGMEFDLDEESISSDDDL